MESIAENNMKWAAIPLTIPTLINPKKFRKNDLNYLIFNKVYEASWKYDGTNVGKDPEGNMYGRNYMIAPTANSYQKTDLTFVKKLEVAPIRDEINALAGLKLENIVVYGELMCNKKLYNYENMDSFYIFGAMI